MCTTSKTEASQERMIEEHSGFSIGDINVLTFVTNTSETGFHEI